MGLGLFRRYQHVCESLALPVIARGLLQSSCGRQYGINTSQKLRLIRAIRRNARSIVSATDWMEHLLLVTRVLSLPRDLAGDIIECGCFKGSSTASLSLACKMTGRRLVVCDSFEGLPEIAEHDVVHVSQADGRFETYSTGEYAGDIKEVQSNVERYGDLSVCDFVKGYFQDTLPELKRQTAMAFLDVDLHDSLRDCLLYLWPSISDYGYVYTHEATQLDYVARFFEQEFWMKHFGVRPPGLVGAGIGIPCGISRGSGLGYTQKLPIVPSRSDDPRLNQFFGDPTRQKTGTPAAI
jgi:O-methyltransferase